MLTRVYFEHEARPPRHDKDAVCHDDRLIDVVRDKYDRLLGLLPDAQHLTLHHAPGQRVERRQRLVHQQDLRVDGKRTGDLEALAHTTRGVTRVVPGEDVELHQAQQFDDDFANRPIAAIRLELQPVSHILGGSQPRKQRGFGAPSCGCSGLR